MIRSNKGVDCLTSKLFNGNQYLSVNNPYASLTIELSEEGKDMYSSIWSSARVVSLNKFLTKTFVRRSRDLLEKFKTIKELFAYEDNVLMVNKDLAWENREVIPTEYGKVVMLLPTVVEDYDTHAQYEGITLMINEISNYGKLTYQEFEAMVDYLDTLDFDTLALQLINIALMMKEKKTAEDIITKDDTPEVPENIQFVPVSEKETKAQPRQIEQREWLAAPNRPQIPEI